MKLKLSVRTRTTDIEISINSSEELIIRCIYKNTSVSPSWLGSVGVDSHNNIYFINFTPILYPDALNNVIKCKCCTVQPLLYIQGYPSTSPALPVSPEEPTTVHHNTPVTGLFPPSVTYTNDVVALGLSQSSSSSSLFLTLQTLMHKHFKSPPVYSVPHGAD